MKNIITQTMPAQAGSRKTIRWCLRHGFVCYFSRKGAKDAKDAEGEDRTRFCGA